MGFSLNPLTGFGLLEADMGPAAAKAEFNPYNIESSYGSLAFDPASRTFTSQLSPELTGLQSGLFSQYGQINPDQQLALMREQAAPFNQAASNRLENRLFSQGRLDASQEYGAGGAMRGLFDSFANQDLQMQQLAQQQSQVAQMNYLNQILGLGNFEQNLFNAGMGMGQIGMQGQITGANLTGQGELANQQMSYNVLNDIAGGAMAAFGMSDIRLKENIEQIGNLESGLPVYKFNYIWSDAEQIGVMAHEAKKIYPEAVVKIGNYYAVDYSRIH